MQGLAKELKQGLKRLHSVQDKMGKQLHAELAEHTQRAQQASRGDMEALDESLEVFRQTTEGLVQSIDAGQGEAAEAGTTLLKVKDEVQASVQQWARGVSEKSAEMVEGLLAHQDEHLSMVRQAFCHIQEC